MGLYGGSPPPPDPVATAQAQSNINKDALITAAQLNQIKQTGPEGSISYTGEVGSPDRTQVTTLSPELQKLYEGQAGAANSLTDIANQRIAGAPGGNFELGTNPVGYIGGNTPKLQTSVPTSTNFTTNVNGGPIATGFDPGGTVQRGVNTDFGNLSKQAQDAEYAKATQYLDPQFQQSDQALQSRLAAQGITQGSDAYNTAMNNAALQKQSAYSDARNQAIGQGDALQNQLFGQSLGAGQFSNAALGQQYGMNQGQAAFQNAAQGQIFGQGVTNAGLQNQAQNDIFNQNLAAGQFGNQAQDQGFQNTLAANNFDQNLYQQGLSNQILGRNQNLNEAIAYMTGTPISPSNPSYQPIPTSTAAQAAPDAVGLAGSNYNAALQKSGGILGSIFGAAGNLGSAAIKACWVAREVFGPENPEWLAFREWLLFKAPRWFCKIYMRHGAKFALWLRNKPILKYLIRIWMRGRINASA